MTSAAPTSLDDRITFRPVVMPDDEPFLRSLYYSTRSDLAAIFQDPRMLEQMLSIQYQGQITTYGERYADAIHNIVLLDGDPVGRTMIQKQVDADLFIDFALIPETRGKGVGSWIFRWVFDQARSRGVPVTLHVEKTNRA